MIRSRVAKIRTWMGLYRFLKKFCKENEIYIEKGDHIIGFVLPIRGNNLNSLIYMKSSLSTRAKCMVLLHELGHIRVKYADNNYYFSYTIEHMNSEAEATEFMREVIFSTKIDLTRGDKVLLGIYSADNG